MTTNEGIAQVVSRTVWLLGQLRGYSSKQALADAMGWDRSRLSRTLNGDRQWTLEDLEVAARVLDLSGPGDLFRPLGELVGAIGALTVNGSVNTRVKTNRYLSASPLAGTPLGQVIPFPRLYQTVNPVPAIASYSVTRLGADHRGQHADSA